MVHGIGNVDSSFMDMLRQFIAKLDVAETTQRRGVHFDDVSHDDSITPNPDLEPEKDEDEEIYLRVLSRAYLKPNMKVIHYDGKLDTNVVLD